MVRVFRSRRERKEKEEKSINEYIQMRSDWVKEHKQNWIDCIKDNQKACALDIIQILKKEYPELDIKEEDIKWDNEYLDMLAGNI
jgi:hypothetical protein